MVSIEEWRTRIGCFSGGKVRDSLPWLAITIIASLIILAAGDVESNPGPRNTMQATSAQQDTHDEGISEEDFNQLLVDLAEWYDRQGYLTKLKVLFKDHVTTFNKLDSATTVMDLLSLLKANGNLSSTNLAILYDTIKVTQQFGFKSKVKNQPPENIKEHVLSKFTKHRQKLVMLGEALIQDDVEKLDAIYNTVPLLRKYKDSWSLIMDLEHRLELEDGKMDNFIKVLQSNGMYSAANTLLDGLLNYFTITTKQQYNR